MLQEILLYLENLVFLVGTFVYGFLVRELFRQRSILPGNQAIRALALALAIWYSGSLLDELAFVLVRNQAWWAAIGPYVDVLRGLAWVASYPLLAHTMWSFLDERKRPSFREVAVCYLILVPFLWIAADVITEGETALARVGREAYQLFVVLVTLSVLLAARFTYIASRSLTRPDIVRFLRWLLGTLLVVEGLVLTGAVGIDIWTEPLWRILVSSSSLVLGFTFLYFVRRYNLMSLSLSNRSLRHFSGIVGLILLVLLGGWALGIAESDVFRRFLALGVLVGAVSGLLYRPFLRWTSQRSPRLARSLGRGIPRKEIDDLTARLQDVSMTEEEMAALVESELTRLLHVDVRLFRERNGAFEPIWNHFETETTEAFNRVRAPTSQLADALAQADLHAAFPLRVRGALEGVFVIPSSATGGAYDEGEMESVKLVVRQLSSAIAIGRLVEQRLAAEREESERERLSMLGMVTASLAHELKNPLSSMKVLAQTVREELTAENPAGEHAKDLGVIVEQIERLSGVAKEILGFTRPLEGAEGTDVSSIVESVSYVLDHEAGRRGIEIDRSSIKRNESCRGTPATWQTVVFNLVLNAVHHAPPSSTVRLRLGRRNGRLVFECENGGPPIPTEIIESLFDPFVSRAAEGTGLGLALVDRRVRELGGSIVIINEPNHIVFRVRV